MARRDRLPGLVVLAAALVSALTLATPGKDSGTLPDGTVQVNTDTLYSWTSWVLVAALVVVGLLLVLGRMRSAASAVGVVAAAQLAGTGIVAVKHWQPFTGLGAPGGGSLGEVKLLAVAMALAGALAGVACGWVLLRTRTLTARIPSGAGKIGVVVGLILALGLPWAIAGGEPQMQDMTSLGAMALIYSLPWGLPLVLTGCLSLSAGRAATGAVLASVVLALVGPEMKALMYANPTPAFVAALAATGAILAVQGAVARRAAPIVVDV